MNEITKHDLDSIKSTASLFMESGLFSDTKSLAQACTKIIAGAEMGMPPFEAMTSIDIIQGRTCLTSNAISRRIKDNDKVDYQITELTNMACRIQFFEDGEPIGGPFSFTMEDAKLAGKAASSQYRQHPRNMLFARCISNGARIHCPNVFSGPVYTPEELQTDLTPHVGGDSVQTTEATGKLGTLSLQSSAPDKGVEEAVVVLSDTSSTSSSQPKPEPKPAPKPKPKPAPKPEPKPKPAPKPEPKPKPEHSEPEIPDTEIPKPKDGSAWSDQLESIQLLFDELNYPPARREQGAQWASQQRTSDYKQLSEKEADALIVTLSKRQKKEGGNDHA